MDFRILGPFEVWDGDDRRPLGPYKQQALLVRLLLDAGRVVAMDRLVDDIWGEAVPESAVKMVQIYVSGLRKILPAGCSRRAAPATCSSSATTSSTCIDSRASGARAPTRSRRATPPRHPCGCTPPSHSGVARHSAG